MAGSAPNTDTRNLVIAIVLSTIILGVWQYFIEIPRQKAHSIAMRAQAQTQQQLYKEEQKTLETTASMTRADWLKASPRVRINSDKLHGSIALNGLHFDDLTLAQYHDTLDPKSPEVVLLSPAGDTNGYFAQFGWSTNDASLALPDDTSAWSADAPELTPDHPVTFTWKNPAGVVFLIKVSLDKQYMFTITQSAKTDKPLRTYAFINRVWDIKAHPSSGIMHEGPLGVFDNTLKETTYKKMSSDVHDETMESHGGWLGISDKYWLASIIPSSQQPAGTADTAGAAAAEPFTAHFSYYTSKSREHYQTDYLSEPKTLDSTTYFFAGAKKLSLLDDYAAQYHIPLFDRAIDFGMFYFLTKPIFLTLNYFQAVLGNFGLAIMLLTILVKAMMFPLASKSFKSMQQMKTLTPKMNDIRERYKDDKVKMNQEIMELYKREKVNPASGCLPMFIQIPVFFALYKVLYVTIEMRQAPFYGWIHDLSAPDPTNLFTLFGAVHWTPPTFLHLGIWPMIMCATMIIQQQQSPPPPDPAQAKVMRMLPFIFLFTFSNFAAGLVIYWCWSNTLTILQQWYIAARHTKK